MNKSQPMLTKTCSNCGLQKPLSAFLEMGGVKGAAYGNICSSCRKAALEKQHQSVEKETSSTSSTGLEIGYKEKVKDDIVKKQKHQEVEERYHEDRDKQEEKQTKSTEKTQTIATDEKKHRESFLKQRSFLSTTKTEAQHKAENKQQIIEHAVKQEVLKDTVAKQEQAVKEDLEVKNIDLSAPFFPSQTGAQLKHSGIAFQALKSRLKGSAPFINRAELAAQKLDPGGNLVDKNEIEIVEKLSGPGARKR